MPVWSSPPVFSLPLSHSGLATLLACFSDLQGSCTCCSLCLECSDLSILPLCTIWISFEMSLPTPRCLLWPTTVPPHLAASITFMCFVVFLAFYYLEWLCSQTLMKVFYPLVPPCSLARAPWERDLIHLTAIHVCNYMQHWEQDKYKFEWRERCYSQWFPKIMLCLSGSCWWHGLPPPWQTPFRILKFLVAGHTLPKPLFPCFSNSSAQASHKFLHRNLHT